MSETLIIDETEFQAACPALVDRLGEGGFDRIEMTRAGRVVAVVTAPAGAPALADGTEIHGFMRNSVILHPDLDLTAPIMDRFQAEEQDDLRD